MSKYKVVLEELDEQDREEIFNLVEFKKMLKKTNEEIVKKLTKKVNITVEELVEKGENNG